MTGKNMKVLHLNLKKKWFDMIASGEKTEEYREIKPYWNTRLYGKEFDLVKFRNGYSKEAPTLSVKLKDMYCTKGKKEWGAPDVAVWVLFLGEIINE